MMKITKIVPVIAAALVGCDERPETPENWKIKPIDGKTFYNANIGPKPHVWRLWDSMPDDPLFDALWFNYALPLHMNDVAEKQDEKGNYYFAPPKYEGYSFPVKLTDVLSNFAARVKRDYVEEFAQRRPNQPIIFAFHGGRPLKWLKDTFDTDQADFAAWRAKHPGFFSFQCYDEYDNDINSLRWQRAKFTNAVDRARLDRDFPETGSNEDIRHWTDRCHEKAVAFHFKSDALDGLWSVMMTTAFDIARKGAKMLWYEAELGSTSGPWVWGGIYARGAARQFNTRLGWYTATFTNNQVDRKGERPPELVRKSYSGTLWPNTENRNVAKYMGASRSLMKRNEAYGYFIGSLAMQLESASHYICAEKDGMDCLSMYGEDYREFYVWHSQHERGVPYTPIAMLVSLDEQMDRQAYLCRRNHDPITQTAFLTTLVCPRTTATTICCDAKAGFQGCLWNSEFGEIVDAVCPDAGQESADFAKALRAYKVAILVGWFNKKYFDTRAVVDFVKQGGVLYAEKRHIEAGLIPAAVDGARGRIELVDSFVSEKVKNIKDIGKANAEMFSNPDANPAIRNLFRRLQDEYMPVKVEGDIQWGCNLTSRGWLVWLINNKGVKKFLAEPQELDPAAAAKVRVTRKATGRVYETVVGPGDWAVIEIPADADHLVNSQPGREVEVREFGAYGDGSRDDAPAIQRALDMKERPLTVRIPFGNYRIGRTLYISGGTRIEAARDARIFMCERTQHHEGDYLLTNAGSTHGVVDAGIEVTGGIWDGNNRRGTNVKPADIFQTNGWSGVLFNFRRVSGLKLKNLECANSVTYNIRMCEVDGFEISDIRFSSRERGWNQDGIHMNGYCRNGLIENVRAVTKGQTADDLLAFNADDSMTRIENRGMLVGPISNIVCRNIFAEDCHSAVRLLSVGSPIRDIRIENLSAGCRCNLVNADAARYCMTPLFKEDGHPAGVGDIRNVTMSNVVFRATASGKHPLIVMETNVRDFAITGLRRYQVGDVGKERPFLRVQNCDEMRLEADDVVKTVPRRAELVLERTPENLLLTGGEDEYSVPEAWLIKPVMGRTLYSSFRPEYWFQRWEGVPDLPLFRNVIMNFDFSKFPVSSLCPDKDEFLRFRKPEERWRKLPAKFEDVMATYNNHMQIAMRAFWEGWTL